MGYGTYTECPHCGNDVKGTTIWSCRICGFVHCENCDEEHGFCPRCKSGEGMSQTGYVDPNSGTDNKESSSGYTECPRCGKNNEGDTIWQCKDCGCKHCENCDPDSGGCPACGSRSVKSIGYISYD